MSVHNKKAQQITSQECDTLHAACFGVDEVNGGLCNYCSFSRSHTIDLEEESGLDKYFKGELITQETGPILFLYQPHLIILTSTLVGSCTKRSTM